MVGLPGEPARPHPDARVDEHYYIEDHEDGTLRGDPGRYDRQPILPVTAFDARNGMENGDVSSTLQRKGSLNAEPLLAEGVEPQTFDWQISGGGEDKSFKGKGRAWMEDKPGTARALTSNKTLAVHVPAQEEAATLTKGSANEGVSAPGRHKEDDENLIVQSYEVTPGTVASDGPNTLRVKETDQAATLSASDAKKSERGTLVAEGFAQGHQGQLDHFEDETPPLTAGGNSVRNNSPMVFEPAGAIDHPASKLTALPQVYSKAHGASSAEDAENWEEAAESRTLNSMGYAVDVVVEPSSLEDETGTLRQHPRPGSNSSGAVVFESRFARNGRGAPGDEVPPLKAQSGDTGKGDGAPLVASQRAAVRRLTPVECERLQGFPDGWTAIDGDETPDGPRYAALGDAVTVNVAHWIVQRLTLRRELGLE